jgi:enoyl-CoA hydratase
LEYEFLQYAREDGICTVTVNRPAALNALNERVINEVYELFKQIEADPDVRVVIITGSGKAFVAGADVGEMRTQSSVQIAHFVAAMRRAGDLIYSLSKPVIAAINGFALGGGCELAMCCDLRIASEGARFGQPEINLGVIPGFGGTQRLARLVGVARAKELIYTGDMIDAKTALAMGLVNKVVPPENLMPEARALAQKMLSKSSIALSLAKKAINSGLEANLATGLDLEGECFALSFTTEDQKEGMAAFIEKRRAEFKGR